MQNIYASTSNISLISIGQVTIDCFTMNSNEFVKIVFVFILMNGGPLMEGAWGPEARAYISYGMIGS